MCRREESRLPPLPGARQPSCAAHWPHPHDARMASWPLCQHPAPKPGCQGDVRRCADSAPNPQHRSGRDNPSAGNPPRALPIGIAPLRSPALFSPCQGLAVLPMLVDTHGFTHQPPRIPKNTHTHADLSTPAQSLSPTWVQGTPSFPKVAGPLYTPLREPAEG